MIAFCLILLTGLLALFAYPLAPDPTPLANNMVVELSARPAGYRQQFLLVPKARQPEKPGWLSRTFLGTPSDYAYLPINGYALVKDTLLARHHIDAGMEDTLRYSFKALKAPTGDDKWIEDNRIVYKRYLLGTDRYGRDILSRLLIGARVSITVGIVSVVLSLSIGILLGALAGWYGGWVDNAIMYLINILWSIPTLLLVFAITLTIGKGFWEIFVAIGLTSWVSAARLIRGQVLQLKEMDFITAAKFATAILVEAGLSFLGVGVQPPTPSWGLMIKEHYNFLIAGHPLPALIPGMAIMVLVLAFNIVGNALRDAIDVR
jgi:ABC-type dipeptide/oligopeptide/nickel transport system permease subunit